MIINPNSDSYKLIGTILIMTKKYDPTIIKLDIGEIKSIQRGGSPDPDDDLWKQVGKKYKEVKEDLKDAMHKKDVKRITTDMIVIESIIYCTLAYIMGNTIKEVSNSIINLSNNINEVFL